VHYNPNIHHRHSIRLKEYDYSQAGLYFITICCQDKICRFGNIENGEMILNEWGRIAYDEWLKTPNIRPNIQLDEFIVMPNHIHGIIVITNNDGGRGVLHTPHDHTPHDNTPHAGGTGVLHTPHDNTPHAGGTGVLHTPHDNTPDDGGTGVLHTPHDNTPHNGGTSVLHTPHDHTPHDGANGNNSGVCNTPLRSPSNTIGAIIRGYKSAVTKQMHELGFFDAIWQRNYYEHIIRNEQSHQNISNYIIHNPEKWQEDKFYVEQLPISSPPCPCRKAGCGRV
jgi:REP element-mobilizing transposase RayT